MDVALLLKCNRCGAEVSVVYTNIRDMSFVNLKVGDWVAHPTAITMSAWPLHRCSMLRFGTMTPLGFDILDDRVNGREPELGGKDAHC